MLRRHTATCLLISGLLLGGCGSQGYVESDIPGVAEYLGAAAIKKATSRSCPYGGTAYGQYDVELTPSDFTRRRVSYNVSCYQ